MDSLPKTAEKIDGCAVFKKNPADAGIFTDVVNQRIQHGHKRALLRRFPVLIQHLLKFQQSFIFNILQEVAGVLIVEIKGSSV